MASSSRDAIQISAAPAQTWLAELRARRAAVALADAAEHASQAAADHATSPADADHAPPAVESTSWVLSQKNSRPCIEWSRTGSCALGSKCLFSHDSGERAWRSKPPATEADSSTAGLRALFDESLQAGRSALQAGDASRAVTEFESADRLAESVFVVAHGRDITRAVKASVRLEKAHALASLDPADGAAVAAVDGGLALLEGACGVPAALELHARRLYVQAASAIRGGGGGGGSGQQTIAAAHDRVREQLGRIVSLEVEVASSTARRSRRAANVFGSLLSAEAPPPRSAAATQERPQSAVAASAVAVGGVGAGEASVAGVAGGVGASKEGASPARRSSRGLRPTRSLLKKAAEGHGSPSQKARSQRRRRAMSSQPTSDARPTGEPAVESAAEPVATPATPVASAEPAASEAVSPPAPGASLAQPASPSFSSVVAGSPSKGPSTGASHMPPHRAPSWAPSWAPRGRVASGSIAELEVAVGLPSLPAEAAGLPRTRILFVCEGEMASSA